MNNDEWNGREALGQALRESQERASFAARLGIRGDFIRVPQLAMALGLSSNFIHAQMRSGVFPIPHRRLGNTLMVKLDDYIAWFKADSQPWKAAHELTQEAAPPPCQPALERPETPREVAERIKARALAATRRGRSAFKR